MKKATKKKLVLSKETVMALQTNLEQVVGGATTSGGGGATCASCGACNTTSEYCTDFCD